MMLAKRRERSERLMVMSELRRFFWAIVLTGALVLLAAALAGCYGSESVSVNCEARQASINRDGKTIDPAELARVLKEACGR